MKLFCELPKDQKTRDLIKKFIYDSHNGISFFHEDCEIQKHEMEIHRYLTGEDGIRWVEKYAQKERIYLDTLHEIVQRKINPVLNFLEKFFNNFDYRNIENKHINYFINEWNKENTQ